MFYLLVKQMIDYVIDVNMYTANE